jgi:hypothetical protein
MHEAPIEQSPFALHAMVAEASGSEEPSEGPSDETEAPVSALSAAPSLGDEDSRPGPSADTDASVEVSVDDGASAEVPASAPEPEVEERRTQDATPPTSLQVSPVGQPSMEQSLGEDASSPEVGPHVPSAEQA